MVELAAEDNNLDWLSVVGRTSAYLCLYHSGMLSEKLLEQAAFLERFGIPQSEAAVILGSTEKSLKELARRARKASESAKLT